MQQEKNKFEEIKTQPVHTAENSPQPLVKVLAASSKLTESLKRPQTQQTAFNDTMQSKRRINLVSNSSKNLLSAYAV